MIIKNKLLITILFSLSIILQFSCKKTEHKVLGDNTIELLAKKSESIDSLNQANYILKTYNKVDYTSKNNDEFAYEDIKLNFPFNVNLQKTSLVIIKEDKVNFSRFLSDDFDSGDLNLWRYKNQKDNIFLIELDDYYGSVFFVYGLSNNCLFRLGDFVIPQPNVEQDGKKQKTFKISEQNEIIIIERFLDKNPLPKLEFSNNKTCIKSNKKILYPQVETYLNVRSAPNSSGTIVGKAYPNDALLLIEEVDGWVKVSLNGTEGYVSSDYVKEAP